MLLATAIVHWRAIHNMAMVESECYLEETPVSDDLVTLICCLLCAVSDFEESLVAVCCAADVERLLVGAGFQGRLVIFLSVLSLRLH